MIAAGSATRAAPNARTGRLHGTAATRHARCRKRHVRPDPGARRSEFDDAGSRPRPRPADSVDPAVYRRRRSVVGIAVAIAVTVLTLAAQATFTGSGSGPASAAGAGAVAERTVRVRSGDSLWTIAEEHRGSVEINRYIDALVELNGGTTILVNQLVRLP